MRHPRCSCMVFDPEERELPSELRIKYQSFRVHAFTPSPTRCYVCQQFGHTQLRCRVKKNYCPRCAGQHSYDNCPQSEEVKCINCKGDHKAGYQGCPAYKDAKIATDLANSKGLSYAGAVKLLAKEKHQKMTAAARTADTAAAAAKEATAMKSTTETLNAAASNPAKNEPQKKSQEVATTLAGKRNRQESGNSRSQEQPAKMNRRERTLSENSIEYEDGQALLAIDETPTEEDFPSLPNQKTAKDNEFEQLKAKVAKTGRIDSRYQLLLSCLLQGDKQDIRK